jgi:HEAT repeat protein
MLARWGQAEHKEFVSNCGMPDGSIKRYGTIADALCRAIASSGDANALDLLTVALQAKNASVRDGAVQALGDLGDKRAFGHLVAMLKQDDKGASSCDPDRVADAMFKLDAEQAVEPLTKWLTRKPPSTFGDPYLVRELGRRKVPQAAEAIKEELLDTMFRWNSSILGVERSGYDQSLDQCKERASLLAYEAPIAYGRCAGIEAVPLLLVTMRSPNCYHRVSAAQALGELRDRRAVDCLVVALGDQMWPVQEAAAIALRQIGDPAAIGALEAAGQHSDWRVRKASREAVLSIQKTTPTSSPSSQP